MSCNQLAELELAFNIRLCAAGRLLIFWCTRFAALIYLTLSSWAFRKLAR